MMHALKAAAAAGLFRRGRAVGTAQAQTPVTFQLNWTAGGANAGFAAALQEGFYKEAGLDVTIVQGNGSATRRSSWPAARPSSPMPTRWP